MPELKLSYGLFISAAVLLLAVSLWNGIGTTNDSLLYLEGGAYLRESGFRNLFSQLAFRAKPPLFASLLCLINNNLTVVKLLNILCLAGTLYLSFRITDRLISDNFIKQIARFQLAFATPFFLVHSFVWTEPLFILLLCGYVLVIHRYLEKTKTADLLLITLIGLLLILQRHTGIVFVTFSGMFLFFAGKRTLREIAAFSLPVAVFLLWQLLLWMHTQNLERINHTENLDLWHNVLLFAKGIAAWFFPFFQETAFVPLLVAGSALLLMTVPFINREKNTPCSFDCFLLLMTLSYFAFMALKGDLVLWDMERYLAVTFTPFILLFLSGVQYITKRLSRYTLWVQVLLSIWCVYTLVRAVKNVLLWGEISY